jgi:hypothetical protein
MIYQVLYEPDKRLSTYDPIWSSCFSMLVILVFFHERIGEALGVR